MLNLLTVVRKDQWFQDVNTAYHINVLTHHFIKIAFATILEFAIGTSTREMSCIEQLQIQGHFLKSCYLKWLGGSPVVFSV